MMIYVSRHGDYVIIADEQEPTEFLLDTIQEHFDSRHESAEAPRRMN